MGNGFLKFKRYIVTETSVQSLLIGVSCGLFLYALELLLTKLNVLSLSPWILLFPAIGIALLAGVLHFLLHLPTNKRIAKRLDAQLGLAEKVQTLVEYDGKEGDITEVQRQDTEDILASTPLKKIRKRGSIIPTLLALLSTALLAVVIIIPAQVPDDGPPEVVDPDFTLSSWQEQSLLDLIETVRESTMDETPKATTILELESLLTTLRTVKKESGMKAAVVACIVNVSRTVTDYDTYLSIATLLKASENETVKAVGGAIGALSALTTEEELNAVKDALLGMETVAETQLNLNLIQTAFDEAMTPYDKSATDPLYTALMAYISGLKQIYEGMDGTGWPAEELTNLTSTTNTNLTLALMQQFVNETMRQTVVTRLMQIFGISKNDLPQDVVSNASSGGSDGDSSVLPDPDKPLQGGGIDDGEVLYNSNDLVYDPETNSYVVYGTLLNTAYGEIIKLITQGTLTEEEAKLVTEYFNLLFSMQPEEE